MMRRWLSCLLVAQILAAGIALPVGATQQGVGNSGGQSGNNGHRDHHDISDPNDGRRLRFIPIVTEDGLVIDPSGRKVVDVLGSVMSFWGKWLLEHPDK